jgi:hypothetical protein
MKVITRCVIDIETLQVIEEESYNYSGTIALCKGGGGGGSGAVSYPDYMQTVHNDWLDNTGVDTITSSITDIMNSAIGGSPWAGQAAYSPTADITAMTNSSTTFQSLVTLLSSGTTLDTLIANVLDDSRIDDAVDEYAADLDARMISEVLPRFERGMQDINAVSSSAFVIGRALIEQNQDRQVAKYSADLHMKAFSDDAIKVIGLKLEYQRLATSTLAEIYRIKIVAKKEEADLNMEIDEKDAKWDLEVFQYGANLLASIGGGTVGTQKPSTAQSVLGGALSGAAAGAMAGSTMAGVGAIPGAGIGAVLGAATALL